MAKKRQVERAKKQVPVRIGVIRSFADVQAETRRVMGAGPESEEAERAWYLTHMPALMLEQGFTAEEISQILNVCKVTVLKSKLPESPALRGNFDDLVSLASTYLRVFANEIPAKEQKLADEQKRADEQLTWLRHQAGRLSDALSVGNRFPDRKPGRPGLSHNQRCEYALFIMNRIRAGSPRTRYAMDDNTLYGEIARRFGISERRARNAYDTLKRTGWLESDG